ncbi:Ger(x)C family spore germination protein [Bacillus sp. CGMCC 1.16607]|uniref:Ger(x)C family spore germination protein n=1 Tax=Bacillus sp. CGMCC 1.16607 TaxID=3351842 RepID=UPI00363B3728
MKIPLLIFVLSVSVFLLSGCWDQEQLKEARLAIGIGLDETENGELRQTTDIHVPKQDAAGTGRPAFTSVIMKSSGNTFRQARMNLEKEVAGNYAPNKILAYVIGEDLAKKDIYPIFDVLYRYPRNSLGAKIAITKGRAEDIISLKLVEEKMVSDALLKIIESAEDDTFIPKVNIQSICPIIFNEGQDFALPMIEKSDNDQIKISGMALFHGKKYSGVSLTGEDATLLLLLNNEQSNLTRFTLKVNPKEKRKRNQFVNIHAFLKKHDLKIKVGSGDHIKAEIKIKLNLHIIEYPLDNLESKREINKLTKRINEELAKMSDRVISELQKANSDYFGIGKRIKAYHPKEWKLMNWEKVYPTIEINTKIETEIVETGIIK